MGDAVQKELDSDQVDGLNDEDNMVEREGGAGAFYKIIFPEDVCSQGEGCEFTEESGDIPAKCEIPCDNNIINPVNECIIKNNKCSINDGTRN